MIHSTKLTFNQTKKGPDYRRAVCGRSFGNARGDDRELYSGGTDSTALRARPPRPRICPCL